MVSVVLHNACLRMEEEGAGLDEILAPKGIQRWIGRSSLALGGAASLLLGAVFGGILESVPVLLPPPAAASATPSVVNGLSVGSVLTQVADAAPAPVAAAVAAVAAAAPAPTSGVQLPPVSGSAGGNDITKTVGGGTIGGSGGSGTGGGPIQTPTGTPPPASAPTISQTLEGAVNTVTAPVTNAAPVVAPVVQTVNTVISTAPVLSTTTTPSTSPSSTSSTGVGGTLNAVVSQLPAL